MQLSAGVTYGYAPCSVSVPATFFIDYFIDSGPENIRGRKYSLARAESGQMSN